jgi:hypothetical protein
MRTIQNLGTAPSMGLFNQDLLLTLLDDLGFPVVPFPTGPE